jgi:hypothetical protein
MSIDIQLKVMTFSFVFGFIFFFFTFLTKKLIKRRKLLCQVIIDFLLVMDFVFLYLIILFKLNDGMFHIYFLFLVILGFYIGYKMRKIIVNNIIKSCKTIINAVQFRRKG